MHTLLTTVRSHLNLGDFHEDDNLLLTYIQAAEEAVERDLNRPLSDMVNPVTGMLSYSVQAAILLLVGSLYADRESTTHGQIKPNESYRYLLDLSRKIVTL